MSCRALYSTFTWASWNVTGFTGDELVLSGGCPDIRDYDGLDWLGTGVVTHRFKDPASGALGDGAVVMNANSAEKWNTVMMSFSWFDIAGNPPAGRVLAQKILEGVVPLGQGCEGDPSTDAVGNPAEGGPPLVMRLHQNRPNPFNPMTTIRFDLARKSRVDLRIFDAAGRLVRDLVAEELEPDRHAIVWDGLDDGGQRVASGVYFYRLTTAVYSETRKLVVLR